MTDEALFAETPQASDEKFVGRLLRVTVDTVTLPDGRTATREVVHHRGAVAAVPLDDAGIVHLVRQWRHPAGRTLLEIPAGGLGADEAPDACVRRELAEEIGQVPERLDRLTSMYAAPGYAGEVIHIYLARNLHPESQPGDEDENVHVVKMTLDEALAACREGRICDGKSVAGLFLARELLAAERMAGDDQLRDRDA
jgi:ADP-ribose pyrophosphatase